ncbi:MAG: diguanylate cyclase [Bacillota bacterium]|nr:diguanylate cyclase [Bacillota bacterium]
MNNYIIAAAMLINFIIQIYFALMSNYKGGKLGKLLSKVLYCMAFWNLTYGLSFLFKSEYAVILLNQIKYIGISFLPVYLLFFVLSFTKNYSYINLKNFIILSSLPLINLIIIFTNKFHHLFRKEYSVNTINNINIITKTNGVFYYIHIFYMYILFSAALIILLNYYIKQPKLYKDRSRYVIFSLVFPLVFNIFYVFIPNFFYSIDITPLLFLVSCPFIYFSMISYKAERIVPTTRNIVFENMSNLIITLDREDNIIDFNKAVVKIFGDTISSFKQHNFYKIFNNIGDYLSINLNYNIKDKLLWIKNGEEEIYFNVSVKGLYDSQKKYIGKIIELNDITAVKQIMNSLEYSSSHDSLTGIYNRSYFEAQLSQLDEQGLVPVSVVVGNINGLNLINDAFGTSEGDNIIIKASDIIIDSCPKNSIIARTGGDEFGIIIPGGSEDISQDLIYSIRNACKKYKNKSQLSLALGCSTKEEKDDSLVNIIKIAGSNMYRNKIAESNSIRSSIIGSLKKTLEESDFETKEHAERTKILSEKFGYKLKLPMNQMDDLKMLAVLHDIGKLAIPDSILLKPGKLTPKEWEIMKTHTNKGYDIASSSYEISTIARAILCHHEKWDGTGYPEGLKGEEIPILDRIMSIIDAYDVMTHDRPYHKAISETQAVNELLSCSGTQFDPNLVPEFIEIICDKK